MSLFSINDFDDNITLGIWEISETKEELMEEINLSKKDLKELDEIKIQSKKLQWLCVRMLLKNMLGYQPQIIYTNKGKPFLGNSQLKISVSHSDKFVALIINKKEETGIDIEKISNKPFRIKNKFLSSNELLDITDLDTLEKLHVYWGAKESLYKVYGEKEIIFKEDLFISPFKYFNNGEITGSIKKNNLQRSYLLKYKKIQDYLLVFVIKEINLPII